MPLRFLGAALIWLLGTGIGAIAEACSAHEETLDIAGLPGIYTGPHTEIPVPVALIIAGSGPTDRDGNAPALGLRTNAYAKLAWALAERGVASLRFDKRTVGPGAKIPETDVTLELYRADAVALAHEIRKRFRHSRLALLGHSEGGLVALLAASEAGADALVLLSTAGRTLGVVIREQIAAAGADAGLRTRVDEILGTLESGGSADKVEPELQALFRPSLQPFLRSVLRVDPTALLAESGIPAMVVGGGRDIQVKRTDFDALRGAREDVERAWLATMNHVLVDAPDDRAGNLATYAEPDRPLSSGLADAIADFLRAGEAARLPCR